jgi:hypothetical protein
MDGQSINQPRAPPLDTPADPLAGCRFFLACSTRRDRYAVAPEYKILVTGRWSSGKPRRHGPQREGEPHRWYFASRGVHTLDAPRAADAADRYFIEFQATTGRRNRWMTNNTADDVVYGNRRTADRVCSRTQASRSPMKWKSSASRSWRCISPRTHTDGAFFLYLEDVAPDGNLRYAVGTRRRGPLGKPHADRADRLAH